MKTDNKYLNQSNFFTRSLFKLDKEIHRDFVYLIQAKIDFYGDTQNFIKISFNDYLKYKNLKKNDTYSFTEFSNFANEIKLVGGAFYNNINSSFVSFNIIDNIQIDKDNAETLKVELAKFGKIFFFKKELEKYIKKITPEGRSLKYNGHTQIENTIFNVKGARRKKFFEIISQFKNTGFCKISLRELKMYLGYIQIIDKKTNKPFTKDEQLKLLFIPEDSFEFKDKAPRYSEFERNFLIPAINAINKDKNKDINNLKLSKKIKTGRNISYLEFTFNALGRDLTNDENQAIDFFISCGLDKEQVVFLLKRIGYKEMYGRYMKNIERKSYKGIDAKYYTRDTKKEINNLAGYFYKVLYPELKS